MIMKVKFEERRIKKYSFVTIGLVLLLLFHNISFGNGKDSPIWIAVWDYKFNFIEMYSAPEVFKNRERGGLSFQYNEKIDYLNDRLPNELKCFYILVTDDSTKIKKITNELQEIEVLFELDYESYWSKQPLTGKFRPYPVKESANPLYNNLEIPLPDELLPDGHWLLYSAELEELKAEIRSEFIIKNRVIDGYKITYGGWHENDFNYREVLKGYPHGLQIYKFGEEVRVSFYENGIEVKNLRFGKQELRLEDYY